MDPLLIGHLDDGNPLYLYPEDFNTSLHAIGASRSGKSKLAELIARQLIFQRCGTCIIDPHGWLYDDIVRWLAYLRPRQEVILLNPSYDDRIVGFNPFRAGVGDIATHVDRHVQATLKCWGAENGDQTPRLERRLKVVLHTIMEGGYSLEVIPYLLNFDAKDIRQRLVASVSDPMIRQEWAELDSCTKPREFYEQVESVRNRLFRFLGNRQVRRTLGLTHNIIDLPSIVNQGKILLVNLQPSALLSEENARLIGTLLLSELWQFGSQRRKDPIGRRPKDFFILIDEFWKFLTPDIPHMLSEGHKYGYHLLLFHQYLDQISEVDPQAFGAVKTNARIKIAFGGISRADAAAMVDEMLPNQVQYKHEKLRLEHRGFEPVADTFTVRTTSTGGGSTSSSNWASFPGSSRTFSESFSSSSGESTSEVPITRYEEYRETSSVQFYSLEEELRQQADNLMDQEQRRFTIRIPGRQTVSAVTPLVLDYPTRQERVDSFTKLRVDRFLKASEVDQALAGIHRQLVDAVVPTPIEFNPDSIWEK